MPKRKVLEMECLLMGKRDSREETQTFSGEDKSEIRRKAEFYAAYNNLEILFFQSKNAGSVNGFWGGVYAA